MVLHFLLTQGADLDRKGAADSLRDVRKQYQRNHELFKEPPAEMPVFGTIASRFNDDGVTALYQALVARLGERGLELSPGRLPAITLTHSSAQGAIVPSQRVRYLAEIADTVRGYHRHADAQARIARERQQLRAAQAMLGNDAPPALDALIAERGAKLDARSKKLLDLWPKTKAAYAGDEYVVKIRDKELRTALTSTLVYGAIARGYRTASLQSTPTAERMYAAVGFRDLGRIVEYVPTLR